MINPPTYKIVKVKNNNKTLAEVVKTNISSN